MDRARHGLRALLSLIPETAVVSRAGTNESIPAEQVRRVLSGLHHFQVDIGAEFDRLEGVVKHLAMLTRGAERHADPVGMPSEGVDNGSELDYLRPRTEDDQDPLHSAQPLYHKPFCWSLSTSAWISPIASLSLRTVKTSSS